MSKSVVMIIAPSEFKDEEYFHSKQVLIDRGIDVKTASKELTAISVSGKEVKCDLLIEDVNVDNYDCVVFVGGAGASVYFDDDKVQDIAVKANEQGKIVAAICIAPSILANAGILEGKRVTAFPSQEANLEEKGASYTGESVTVDGHIVTGNGPESAKDFGERIAELLEGVK